MNKFIVKQLLNIFDTHFMNILCILGQTFNFKVGSVFFSNKTDYFVFDIKNL